jgi:serine protein kinase
MAINIKKHADSLKGRGEVEEMSVEEFLSRVKKDENTYCTAAKRLLKAIGPAEIVHTQKDPRLNIIHQGKTLRTYKTFSDFYGAEETVDSIVKYLEASDLGLEEKRQIMYLLGPVGGGKSSLAARLLDLFEKEHMYILADESGRRLEFIESPLALFIGSDLKELKDVPNHCFPKMMSPYLQYKLKEIDYDLDKLKVLKVHPSKIQGLGISRAEPGDDNNNDVTTLIGKTSLRKLRDHEQSHPFAYDYCGALNKANNGIFEFIEMFKSPKTMLHPLLTATQDRDYSPSENFASLPFDGIVIAHSNETEWKAFQADNKNEAILDRVYLIKVPYVLAYSDEKKIYEKIITSKGEHIRNTIAPHTLETMAKLAVVSRLNDTEQGGRVCKLKVYNGEVVGDANTKSVSIELYKEDDPSKTEGMDGLSTRFATKAISRARQENVEDPNVTPLSLVKYLIQTLTESDRATRDIIATAWGEKLEKEYYELFEEHLQQAYLPEFDEGAQAKFDLYVEKADFWCDKHAGQYFREQGSGIEIDKDEVDKDLSKLEKALGIANPKEFRSEIVDLVLRHRGKHEGKNPRWDANPRFKKLIGKTQLAQIKDLIPFMADPTGRSDREKQKIDGFLDTMRTLGYSKNQVISIVNEYVRFKGA